MATAGDIAVKLGLDSKSFIEEMDKTEKELNELENKLKTSETQFEAVAKAMSMSKNPSKQLQTAFKSLKQELKDNKNAYGDFEKNLKKLDGGLIQGKNSVNLLQGALGKLVAGGAIVALGKQMIDFSAKSVEAYRVQDRAIKGLNTALQNAGVYTTEYSNHLQKLSSEIQSFSNYGDEAVEKAIGLGQAYSGNIKLTDDLIKATVDYAAATETDLQTAFTLVGKSIGTSTNALARYGVSLDDSMSKEQKMEAITKTLSQRFNGSAKDMADTATQLKNATGDLSEAFGKVLNPAVEKTQNILIQGAQKLTNWINKVRVLKSEINSLESIEDLTLRAQENVKRMNDLIGQSGDYKAAEAFRRENQGIYEKIRKLKEQQKQLADDSKNNFVPMETEGTGKKTGKSSQDKALEAYKKYVEEYAKINDDYAATLKARQYVEGTLNIDLVTQKEEYDKMVALYQAHLSKMAEIRRSGTKNQAEIERLEEEKLAQDLQTLRLDKERETRQKLQEIIKGYKDTQKDYEYQSQAEAQLGGFLGSFTSGYQKRLEVLKWYLKERETLQEAHYNNLQEQSQAFYELEQTKQLKEAEIAKDIWTQRGQDIAGIFNQTFSTMLTNYGDFSDNMKQLAINLSTYLTKELAKSAFDWIMQTQTQQGGLITNLTSLFGNLSGSLSQVGQSGTVAAAGVTAVQTAQTALQPIQAAVSATSATASADYIAQAAAAQQLAAATAQLAISEAALSVAKIPYVGGFLAPVAAAATGAGIAAAVAMVSAASLFSKVGNIGSSLGGSIKSVSASLPKHHSGGMIPGTKEQVAVLQGGERVLNRSEAQDYNNDEDQNQGTTIINAFNIRAWDGKDVINTLKANAQTINQITASGLKNNNQGLRTIVQNM